ncbi:hypothetical protein BMS3Abin07_01325 [bacterium BMS3Abin07]|nr:hypothetical protein BMS3Abin07_01325 [bacterium BMS3Abin07]
MVPDTKYLLAVAPAISQNCHDRRIYRQRFNTLNYFRFISYYKRKGFSYTLPARANGLVASLY